MARFVTFLAQIAFYVHNGPFLAKVALGLYNIIIEARAQFTISGTNCTIYIFDGLFMPFLAKVHCTIGHFWHKLCAHSMCILDHRPQAL